MIRESWQPNGCLSAEFIEGSSGADERFLAPSSPRDESCPCDLASFKQSSPEEAVALTPRSLAAEYREQNGRQPVAPASRLPRARTHFIEKPARGKSCRAALDKANSSCVALPMRAIASAFGQANLIIMFSPSTFPSGRCEPSAWRKRKLEEEKATSPAAGNTTWPPARVSERAYGCRLRGSPCAYADHDAMVVIGAGQSWHRENGRDDDGSLTSASAGAPEPRPRLVCVRRADK